PLFLCFFFFPSSDLSVLHSFPTRRSSDLAGVLPRRRREPGRRRRPGARGGAVRGRSVAGRGPARRGAARRRAVLARLGAAVARRSEEHTSELQSRVDLVCRLLLEKKNDGG